LKFDEAARFVVYALIIAKQPPPISDQRSRFIRTVIRITNKGKIRPIRQRALNAMPTVDDQASVVALIQAVIPLGLQAVGEVLEADILLP